VARFGTILDRRQFLLAAGALAACSGSGSNRIRLALNWKPDPQFGGLYAAPYADQSLNVDILPGGAGTPTVQMIGAGAAEFGIVSADELVIARSRGNDVVALFAVFQNNPQGIMVHASRKLKSIADVVGGGTLAIQRGLPYARLLEKKYGLSKVKVVPSPGGDITAFLADPNFAQQCFIMSEPLAARRQGSDPQVFPVSELGYNSYTTVLATSGKFLVDNSKAAQSMVAAVRSGWRSYLDNPEPANQTMQQLNPSMASDVFREVAKAQADLIETGETRRGALGMMTKTRWSELIGQLQELGDISSAPDPDSCFRAF